MSFFFNLIDNEKEGEKQGERWTCAIDIILTKKAKAGKKIIISFLERLSIDNCILKEF